MTYEERKQLDALSRLVYGKSSKWNSILNKGETSDMEETLEDGTVRKYRGIKYLTVDEVKAKMEKIWADELARQEAAKKKEQEKALDTMVVEGEKLGLYDDQVTESELSELEMEAVKQKEMIKERAGS